MNVSELWRKQPKMAVLAAAIALTLGSAAQQQEPTRENANRPPATQTPQPNQSTQIARSDTGMQTLEQHLQSKSLRVSKLVGMELQTRSGDNLGEVEDVLRGTFGNAELERYAGPFTSFWAELYQDRTYRIACRRQ